MAYVQARVTIRGTRPLLWHHFGPEALPLTKQERTGVAGNDPEEWRRTVLATAAGQLYLLPTQVFGCLRDAARYTKSGRGTVQAKMAATLQVLDAEVLVDRNLPEQITTDRQHSVYLDVQGVRNPASKARNVRYRVAAAPGWSCTFQLFWDATIVSRQEMQAVLRDAGQLVGLGDGRSIGYGRFEVQEFDVQERVSA